MPDGFGFGTVPECWVALQDVEDEVARSNAKHGEQRGIPDGTSEHYARICDQAKSSTDAAARDGSLTRRHILTEEFYEALAETELYKLRDELVQVAAVAVNWIVDIDRRSVDALRAGLDRGIPEGA